MPWLTRVRPSSSAVTSCHAVVIVPSDRLSQVHDRPGSTVVTSHTTLGKRGCLIANWLPTAISGPSRATALWTEAVQSDQWATSRYTAQTVAAGATISALLSYFTRTLLPVGESRASWRPAAAGVRGGCASSRCRAESPRDRPLHARSVPTCRRARQRVAAVREDE